MGRHVLHPPQRPAGDKGWNVIVAYGNCNHDKDRGHPSYGPVGDPWGPNGTCDNKIALKDFRDAIESWLRRGH